MTKKRITFRMSSEGVDELRRDLEALGPAGKQAFEKIQDSAPQIANALRRSEREAESFGRTLRSSSDRGGRGLVALTRIGEGARDGLEDLAMQGGALGSALRGLGPAGLVAAAGIGGTVLSARELTRAAREAFDEIQEISRQSDMAGVGVEAFQELTHAGARYGVTVDALTDALKELQIRADEFADNGKGPGAEAFKQLGLSMAEVNRLAADTPAMLGELIAKMEGLDKASQIRLADELFGGQGGEQLVAMIDAGRDALERLRQEARDLGVVIDTHTVTETHKLSRELETLERITSGNLNQALVTLGPVLVKLARYASNFATGIREIVDAMREVEARSTASLQSSVTENAEQLARWRDYARTGELPFGLRVDRALLGQDHVDETIQGEIDKYEGRLRAAQAELERRFLAADADGASPPRQPPGGAGAGAAAGQMERYRDAVVSAYDAMTLEHTQLELLLQGREREAEWLQVSAGLRRSLGPLYDEHVHQLHAEWTALQDTQDSQEERAAMCACHFPDDVARSGEADALLEEALS